MPDRADQLRALAAGASAIADRLDAGEQVSPPELLEVLLPGMDALLQLAEAGIVPTGAVGLPAVLLGALAPPEEVWTCGECSELVRPVGNGDWIGLVFGSVFCAPETWPQPDGRPVPHAVDRSHRG